MKNLKEYQWNYIAAGLFAIATFVFILQGNTLWIAFLPLSIVFFTLGNAGRKK